MFIGPGPFSFISIGVRRSQRSGLKPVVSLLNKTIASLYLPPQRARLINFHLVPLSGLSAFTLPLTRGIFDSPQSKGEILISPCPKLFGDLAISQHPAPCFHLQSTSQHCWRNEGGRDVTHGPGQPCNLSCLISSPAAWL